MIEERKNCQMYTIKMMLNTADDARRLVRLTNTYSMDVDARREHILLDAKSLVSMLAVVHIPGLELDIHGEEAGALADMLEQEGFCETFHEYKEKQHMG